MSDSARLSIVGAGGWLGSAIVSCAGGQWTTENLVGSAKPLERARGLQNTS